MVDVVYKNHSFGIDLPEGQATGQISIGIDFGSMAEAEQIAKTIAFLGQAKDYLMPILEDFDLSDLAEHQEIEAICHLLEALREISVGIREVQHQQFQNAEQLAADLFMKCREEYLQGAVDEGEDAEQLALTVPVAAMMTLFAKATRVAAQFSFQCFQVRSGLRDVFWLSDQSFETAYRYLEEAGHI